MIFLAAFGVITFALNRHKLMGAIGITLTLLALWGGGASAQVGPRYDLPGYVGVDWFILDLMLSAMIFIFPGKDVAAYPRAGDPAPRLVARFRAISCSTIC